MGAEDGRTLIIFHEYWTSIASKDRAQILCQYLHHVYIDRGHDGVILPQFQQSPYIGIKSRPDLSRQRAYSEWTTADIDSRLLFLLHVGISQTR